MPSIQWVYLLPITQVVCGSISCIVNSFLAFLILKKSPKEMGSYKWLLLYTTVFEMVYTFVNFFGGPSVHTYGSAFIAFLNTEESYFGRSIDEIFIYTYCSCFGFSMAIFSAHFIYRYGAMNSTFYHKYLRGPRQISLYVFPVVSGFFWGLVCWIFLGESSDKTEYLRNTMMENYELNIDKCVYVSARFWLTSEDGHFYPDVRAFFAILLVWIILGASLSSVLYFGISCYRWISELLENTGSQSAVSRALQSQLFNALLVQSAIPLLLMYAPTGIVFIFPMLNIQLNINYGFVALTIAIYPAIDPFPTIFIIKRYRTGAFQIFRKLFCSEETDSTMQTSTTVAPMSRANSIC
ncbi:unnamed protein product [Caenorhabditis brenneri]